MTQEISISLENGEAKRIKKAAAERHNAVQRQRADNMGWDKEELSGTVRYEDVNLAEAVMKILEHGVEDLEQ